MSMPPTPPHPSGNAFNRLAKRRLGDAIAAAAARHARGRLIDLGCGEKPYAAALAPHVDEHLGVDHAGSPHALASVDVLAGAYEIPLADASFDTALMAEVLEHLEDPGRALAEAHRLLRTGGTLILTAPFMWPLHEEPRDFFRYSPHGLRHLLAGFEPVTVTPVAGKWSTLATFASYTFASYRVGPLRLPIDLFARAVQWLAVRLDELHFQPTFSWDHV